MMMVMMTMMMMMMIMMIMMIVSVERRPGWGEHVLTMRGFMVEISRCAVPREQDVNQLTWGPSALHISMYFDGPHVVTEFWNPRMAV